MFNATIFKTAVISLSGIMEETYAAKEAIMQWNQINAAREGKLFMPTEDPKTVDVLVCTVGNRIEKTELIDERLRAGKQVLLFFNAFQDPKNTITSEQSAVADYMHQMQLRCFCTKFNGAYELNASLNEQLNKIQ